MRRTVSFGLTLILVAVALACSNDSGSPTNPSELPVGSSTTIVGAASGSTALAVVTSVTEGKVALCHVTGNGRYGLIEVDAGSEAEAAHRAHGDGVPLGPVPGEPRLRFDAACGIPRPGVNIEKATNGADADTAPGPEILVGLAVEWTYVVTNTGDFELTNLVVVDNQIGVIAAGSCTATSLLPGASMTCTASGNAVVGQYTNLGTVTADVTSDLGLDPVSASDPSHYLGIIDTGARLGVDIEKATNGADADTAPGPEILVGLSVEWTYVVTNTGDVELTSLVVVDDQIGEIPASSCTATSLLPGASMTCTASGIAVVGQYANIGMVTAGVTSDDLGLDPVSASDPSHYLGIIDQEPEGNEKVKLCHRTGSGRYNLIDVSVNAEPAHLRHGDGYPGQAVPGDPSSVFDARCAMLDAAPE